MSIRCNVFQLGRVRSRLYKTAVLCALVGMPLGMALAAPIDPSTTNGPHILSNRTTTTFVEFDALPNTATNDPNRIDGFYEPALDDGSSNYNYAANEPSGGPSHCNDPDEYFGQALGYPDVARHLRFE